MILQQIFENLNWQSRGIRVNQDRLTHLRFADDIVLFAETNALHYALKQKWQWAGHIARYTDNRWTLKTTVWKGPRGRRRRGRPKKRWIEEIEAVEGNEWRKRAIDRVSWKKLEEAFTRKGVPIDGTEGS
ncbi:unnamed protein product [Pieris macdunnoughi]|uniref:Reverse transcriptase domain-containing protein n=1 Tax=Pieris macdunnoughi TaxID=345717 RepID=A0A821Y3M6_9NEOP|nr:unnamed protein product [Pieris macdunnoughi]